jgi:hypothetical protein
MSTNLTAVLQQILQNTTNLKVLRELKHEIPERVGGSRHWLGLRCRYLENPDCAKFKHQRGAVS